MSKGVKNIPLGRSEKKKRKRLSKIQKVYMKYI
jgi:hypothetical protein